MPEFVSYLAVYSYIVLCRIWMHNVRIYSEPTVLRQQQEKFVIKKENWTTDNFFFLSPMFSFRGTD